MCYESTQALLPMTSYSHFPDGETEALRALITLLRLLIEWLGPEHTLLDASLQLSLAQTQP
jgi:hypothetical protein